MEKRGEGIVRSCLVLSTGLGGKERGKGGLGQREEPGEQIGRGK